MAYVNSIHIVGNQRNITYLIHKIQLPAAQWVIRGTIVLL